MLYSQFGFVEFGLGFRLLSFGVRVQHLRLDVILGHVSEEMLKTVLPNRPD